MGKFCSECGQTLKDGLTHVQIILDESGSMGSTKDETISGFNEYIDNLNREENADKLRFSLTKFNTVSRVIFTDKALADVPRLSTSNFIPGGMTALYDAVGQSVNALKDKVGNHDRALVIILTDGGENSSREFGSDAIRKLITSRQDSNWTFAFLGADQDAWITSQTMGVASTNTSYFGSTQSGRSAAMRNVSTATANFASSASASTNALYRDAGLDNQQNVDVEPPQKKKLDKLGTPEKK